MRQKWHAIDHVIGHCWQHFSDKSHNSNEFTFWPFNSRIRNSPATGFVRMFWAAHDLSL
jgi:hypothetical protein